ncbi:hypothetical protein HYH03_012089 [Edaphochlamys debaryana]|uniref:Phospholipid/glycerol acyltransferase domain-containing protein n=1 Tax=Edaphochlamys debaryana TaxID=47281 RepID=A0A835XSJ7_9CHLO|nr:hypothetical protein HYH03_012089 [Edaphochlamys debaryana]|eukprot:KAG2489453.1 hypothetical protein HYH03_012089 [Edaphochlamys debaryana]
MAVSKLLGLPAFLFSVFAFYWSLPMLAITYRLRFLNLGKRNDMLDWGRGLVNFFAVTIYKVGDGSLYKGGSCLYLCNHRSWADFFIDIYITEGRGAMMSRWLVFFVFPIFCSAVVTLKGIILFKRGTIADKEKFNAWLDATLASSPVPGMLVYPEGHRSIKPHSLPLKRGMLHYAFSRKLPVQVIITRGKDDVLSEKTMAVHWRRQLVTSYGKVIKPSECASFDAFMHEVQTEWDKHWAEAYNAPKPPSKSLPRLVPAPHGYDYPLSMRLGMGSVTTFSIFAFAGVLYGTYCTALWVLAFTGAAQKVIVTVLALWMGLALTRAVL